jgi:hypothetical protein
MGINPNFYVHRERSYDELLPWDIIDSGVTKEFLISENNKAIKGVQSPDCRLYCIGCGINKRVNCAMEGTL